MEEDGVQKQSSPDAEEPAHDAGQHGSYREYVRRQSVQRFSLFFDGFLLW